MERTRVWDTVGEVARQRSRRVAKWLGNAKSTVWSRIRHARDG